MERGPRRSRSEPALPGFSQAWLAGGGTPALVGEAGTGGRPWGPLICVLVSALKCSGENKK